jgi:hypothetical protein
MPTKSTGHEKLSMDESSEPELERGMRFFTKIFAVVSIDPGQHLYLHSQRPRIGEGPVKTAASRPAQVPSSQVQMAASR